MRDVIVSTVVVLFAAYIIKLVSLKTETMATDVNRQSDTSQMRDIVSKGSDDLTLTDIDGDTTVFGNSLFLPGAVALLLGCVLWFAWKLRAGSRKNRDTKSKEAIAFNTFLSSLKPSNTTVLSGFTAMLVMLVMPLLLVGGIFYELVKGLSVIHKILPRSRHQYTTVTHEPSRSQLNNQTGLLRVMGTPFMLIGGGLYWMFKGLLALETIIPNSRTQRR